MNGFRDNFSRVAGREIARMDGLLDRFRMLSSASRQPIEPMDVTIPLRDTLELLQPRLEERRVTLRRLGDGVPPVSAKKSSTSGARNRGDGLDSPQTLRVRDSRYKKRWPMTWPPLVGRA